MVIDKFILRKINKLSRQQIVTILESVCIQCYDHETTEELEEALRVNIEDGTISIDDLDYAIGE